MSTTIATAAGRPRCAPPTGSTTVAATGCDPAPGSCGATTGWLTTGALDPPDGSDGSTGIAADECDRVGVGDGVGVADGEVVGVGGGVGEWDGGVGASDSTGDGMSVCVCLGVGGAASTEIVPRPVRTPSVAVTVAPCVATNAADADAGVFAGRRVENEESETFTVTVTSVRFANRTHPPVGTRTEETSSESPRPWETVMLPHDCADAAEANATRPAPQPASASASPVSHRQLRVTPPWCVSRPSVRW